MVLLELAPLGDLESDVLVDGTTAENVDYFDIVGGWLPIVFAFVLEAWVPLFLFSVLFGLSMDYQVFLHSRIKERYTQAGDTAGAVAFGVGSTARLPTGAALIIIAVFGGFAAGDLVMFQQMGFGVAVALLVDATIVRSVLVPASMKLLGERNWYRASHRRSQPRCRRRRGATHARLDELLARAAI